MDTTNTFTFHKLEQNTLREIIAFISNAVTAYYVSESSLLLIMPILNWFFTFQVQTGFRNTFISLLMNLLPPESVCSSLHLCPRGTAGRSRTWAPCPYFSMCHRGVPRPPKHAVINEVVTRALSILGLGLREFTQVKLTDETPQMTRDTSA